MCALVTGAAGGIGLATARRLLAEGCRVTLSDLPSERLDAAVASLSQAGEEVCAVAADLNDPTSRARLVPAVLERWGQIDVLVNNAADHGPRVHFLETSDADWERVLAVNVTAAAALSRDAARNMLTRRSGSIVNVASVQAALPVATYSAYVASKGAVLTMTRALAAELSPRGIRVNTIAPGVIGTESFGQALAAARDPVEVVRPTAALLGREGEPEEVAAAVAFLASSDASFVTGSCLTVDGGRSVSRRIDPFESEFGTRGSGDA